jgi:glutamate carboxypeptidase
VSGLFAYLDGVHDEQIDLLRRMVSIDSGTDDKQGVDEVGRLLRFELDRLGLSTEAIPQRSVGDHLRAHKPGSSPREVLLVGHMDTVFPRGTVAARPFRLDQGRAYGPGVYDMQGGLAVLVFALRALREAAPHTWDHIGVRIVLNSDEEPGSETSRDLIAREAQSAALACVLEPARPAGEYVAGRKGVARYLVSVKGIAAHSGNQPQMGASAISEIGAKIAALDALNDFSTGLTVNVGLVRGGTRVNVVPDRAECEVEMRLPTTQSLELVGRTMEHVSETIAVPRTETTVTGGLMHYPMEPRSDMEREWQLLANACAEVGFGMKRILAGAASDGNTTARFVPTIDGMGPRGDRAHSPEEYIEVATLVERTKALARFLQLWHEAG